MYIHSSSFSRMAADRFPEGASFSLIHNVNTGFVPTQSPIKGQQALHSVSKAVRVGS
jgi:hypothetical protein